MAIRRAIIILTILLMLIVSTILILEQDKPGTGDAGAREAGAEEAGAVGAREAGAEEAGAVGDEVVGAGAANRASGGFGPEYSGGEAGDGTAPYHEQSSPADIQNRHSDDNNGTGPKTDGLLNEEGMTVCERILTPQGFERIKLEEGSFGQYLRDFPVKPHGTKVRYYDGRIKPWDVHAAVLDIDVGDRDLQQCADAVIRLRAEYLYSKELYDRIHFNFTNGFNAEYARWIEGDRIRISGNKAGWVRQGTRDTGYVSFRKYLDMVFAYAGTQSLSQEMKNIDAGDARPGDVFLKGGSPGHCVIITDMAENPETGEKIFITAQSYMPAQNIHILKNPANDDENPWYPLDFGDELVTPEWTFTKDQVFRFSD